MTTRSNETHTSLTTPTDGLLAIDATPIYEPFKDQGGRWWVKIIRATPDGVPFNATGASGPYDLTTISQKRTGLLQQLDQHRLQVESLVAELAVLDTLEAAIKAGA